MNNTFHVDYDDYLSPMSQSLIHDQLLGAVQKKKSLSSIITELKQTHTHIKDIAIAYRPTDIKIKLTSHEPQCIVNESLVFIDAGYLLDRSLFAEEEIASLPSFVISQDILPDSVHIISHILQQVPTPLYNDYTIHVKNKHTITFTSKSDERFSVIAAGDQSLSSVLFEHCAMVKNDITKNELKDKNGAWVADTRFAHYIVAYKT